MEVLFRVGEYYRYIFCERCIAKWRYDCGLDNKTSTGGRKTGDKRKLTRKSTFASYGTLFLCYLWQRHTFGGVKRLTRQVVLMQEAKNAVSERDINTWLSSLMSVHVFTKLLTYRMTVN